MYGFDKVWRGKCFRWEPIKKTEVEEKVKKLENEKTASKDKVTKEIVKGGNDKMVDWI